MTCANHPDHASTSFCQQCGKPICAECTRTAGNAVFCEPCLAARLNTPPSPSPIPPIDTGEPSPTLAAILGLIPGVGAMYNGQYAKGLIHVVIFAILVSLSHQVDLFGLFVAGWVFYQVIDAYHTARARRDGTPLPNPFGFNDLGERLGFTPQATPTGAPPPPTATPNPPPASGPAPDPIMPPYNYSYNYQYPPVPPPPPMPTDEEFATWQRNRFPAGAIVLIALGVIFLLGNLHLLPHNSAREIFPILLMAAGVWIFARRISETHLLADPALRRIHITRAFSGSVWIFLIGFLWLLDTLGFLRWHYSWPVLLIAGGLFMLIRRGALTGLNSIPMPPEPPPAPPADPGTSLAHKTYYPDQEN